VEYDTQPFLAKSGWCGKVRSVLLVPRARYRVEPQNPLRTKNRGRTCTFVGIRRFGGSSEMAAVVWEDTGEYGGAVINDLVSGSE
jgi:hypothetical protein